MAYFKAQQSIQFVPDGHRVRIFQANFRNAVTTAVKRKLKTITYGKEREEILKEDLERNLTLCLHNSLFCARRTEMRNPAN